MHNDVSKQIQIYKHNLMCYPSPKGYRVTDQYLLW